MTHGARTPGDLDPSEAIELLSRDHARRMPHRYEAEIRAAGVALISAVVAAAETAGFTVKSELSKSNDPIWKVIDPYQRGYVGFGIPSNAFEVLTLTVRFERGPRGESYFKQPTRLVFDPTSKSFVGTEEDTYLVPVPGAPRARRNGLCAG